MFVLLLFVAKGSDRRATKGRPYKKYFNAVCMGRRILYKCSGLSRTPAPTLVTTQKKRQDNSAALRYQFKIMHAQL